MKAFLSYSLNDSEQYVLSILVKKLNEQGITVSTSYDNQLISFELSNQINSSSFFIGVITSTSRENQRVLLEWETAIRKRVPAILLVENSVAPDYYVRNNNIISFDRHNPDPSIELVRRKIAQSQNTPVDSAAAWTLGGTAVLSLIALLSTSKK